MGPYIRDEILFFPGGKKDKDSDYVPVLYRPDNFRVIPSAVKYLRPLFARTSSPEAVAITQRNLAVAQSRIDAVGDLDPKRILKCYGYRFGDRPFMIVERVGLERLSQVILENEKPLVDKLKLVYEIGKAIQYLHSRDPPLVHAAIHPHNIWVEKPDYKTAVLSDFGLANLWRQLEPNDAGIEGKSTTTSLPRSGEPDLDLGWRAPEYLLSEREEIVPSGDIFSFASVMLMTFSAQPPFKVQGRPNSLLFEIVMRGKRPDPKQHPLLLEDDSLWHLLTRMWHRDPAERPTIDEVLADLELELAGRMSASSSSDISMSSSEAVANESPTSVVEDIDPAELVIDTDQSLIRGGHADVKRAYWHNKDQIVLVAVKYMRCKGDTQRLNRRLAREARIWTKLQSPFILPLLGFILGEEPRLISPWCDKGTMLDHLAHYLPTESYILNLLIQVGQGIQYLHTLSPSIIHGDIKPSNVVISDQNRAMLCDFGLARFNEGDSGVSPPVDANGTAGYRAPEFTAPGQQSMAGDIYAFAGTILHALTGSPPRPAIELLHDGGLPRQSEHPALVPGDRLWQPLFRCWNPDPLLRPSIDQVLKELQGEYRLRDPAEIDFELHLTGEFVQDRNVILDVGIANAISRKQLRTGSQIAMGYFADVHVGTWTKLDGEVVRVVIKKLRQVDMRSSITPEAKRDRLNKRLDRENAVWGRLRHPHILPVLGVCPGDTPLLVTPWMKNGSMSSYVGNNPNISFTEKLELVICAAKGVEYLHSLHPPICHADIKPGNVLISDDGKNALISDFGLSIALTILRSPNATSGDPQGTGGFQAPELLFGGLRIPAGDVFSFGCLILDVLSGKTPFWNLKEHQRIAAVKDRKIPDPAMHPALPESDTLWVLMRKCWAFDPPDRPSMERVVRDLRKRLDAERPKVTQDTAHTAASDDDST